ncbi:MAG: hypothetical protein JKY54_06245, partial [Flavobacteriales bacterium]|nr:hypothetical protein [Flavobacteriales bacterium]
NVVGQVQVKEKILDALSLAFEGYYLRLKGGGNADLKQEYLNQLYGYQQNLQFVDTKTKEVFEGKIVGVDDKGPIQIQTQFGIRSFFFKEVKFLF